MPIYNNSLREIFICRLQEFDDNICLKFHEPCIDDARIFRASETNLYITPQKARDLAEILLKAAEASDLSSHDSG